MQHPIYIFKFKSESCLIKILILSIHFIEETDFDECKTTIERNILKWKESVKSIWTIHEDIILQLSEISAEGNTHLNLILCFNSIK